MKQQPTALKLLYSAQFLSAFVDNMILFIALAIINRDHYPIYYLPFVQATFLAAYIIMSPWVGRLADKQPKATILIVGNIIKTIGVALFVCGIDPAVSYAVVGAGAVVYSPAKYGILTFLTRSDQQLLQANARLESYTILAIITGMLCGGIMADYSITMALIISMALYVISAVISMFIPKDPGNRSITYQRAIPHFIDDIKALLNHPQSCYSLIGTGSFWLSSATLRMIIFAWIPITLGINNGTDVSKIIAATGIGIAIGALLSPRLISLNNYPRTIWFGLALALNIFGFNYINSLIPTIALLLLIGVFGGIYIVPMNACLQQVGQRLIGSGKTIAVQNFCENSFMFLGVGTYTLAAKAGVSITTSLNCTAIVMLTIVTYLAYFLKKNHN